jgi:hypothetical protein
MFWESAPVDWWVNLSSVPLSNPDPRDLLYCSNCPLRSFKDLACESIFRDSFH